MNLSQTGVIRFNFLIICNGGCFYFSPVNCPLFIIFILLNRKPHHYEKLSACTGLCSGPYIGENPCGKLGFDWSFMPTRIIPGYNNGSRCSFLLFSAHFAEKSMATASF